MPSKVQISPFVKYSTDTRPQYGSATTYRARVAFSRKLEVPKDGRSVTPMHTAWVATTALIDVRAKFAYLGTSYRMVRSERVNDDQGAHHNRLTFVGG